MLRAAVKEVTHRHRPMKRNDQGLVRLAQAPLQSLFGEWMAATNEIGDEAAALAETGRALQCGAAVSMQIDVSLGELARIQQIFPAQLPPCSTASIPSMMKSGRCRICQQSPASFCSTSGFGSRPGCCPAGQ